MEKKMANRKNYLGMLVMVLVFGIAVVGFNSCSKNADWHLNGAWALDENNSEIKRRGGSPIRLIFKNGNFEHVSSQDGSIRCKGTYITDDGKITCTITHLIPSYGNAGLGEIKNPPTVTCEYSVSDDKLTLVDMMGPSGNFAAAFGDIFTTAWPLELIRDKKFKASSKR